MSPKYSKLKNFASHVQHLARPNTSCEALREAEVLLQYMRRETVCTVDCPLPPRQRKLCWFYQSSVTLFNHAARRGAEKDGHRSRLPAAWFTHDLDVTTTAGLRIA